MYTCSWSSTHALLRCTWLFYERLAHIGTKRLLCLIQQKELVTVVKEKWLPEHPPDETVHTLNYIAAIKDRISSIISAEILVHKEVQLKKEFREIFEPIPHVEQLPTDVQAWIKLIDPQKTIKSRSYPCPQKYRDAWQTLIQQHLAAGFIKPSSFAHASPAFIIPKVDLTVLPCWVNDYHQLNSNMITDSHPIPHIDDILNNCAKGKIWATINMTNTFFQTHMHRMIPTSWLCQCLLVCMNG